MFKYIVLVSAVLIAGVLFFAALQPDTFLVERSMLIKAAPETIYPYMSDFHKGDLWSPYEKKDPSMKKVFKGPESGKGAIYEFDGDHKSIGKGRLEIIEVAPPSKIVLTLDMIEPVKGHNIVEYSIEPNDDGTIVTWAMHGQKPFLGKIISLFISMDKMVGGDFEAGLSNLKALVEKS